MDSDCYSEVKTAGSKPPAAVSTSRSFFLVVSVLSSAEETLGWHSDSASPSFRHVARERAARALLLLGSNTAGLLTCGRRPGRGGGCAREDGSLGSLSS